MSKKELRKAVLLTRPEVKRVDYSTTADPRDEVDATGLQGEAFVRAITRPLAYGSPLRFFNLSPEQMGGGRPRKKPEPLQVVGGRRNAPRGRKKVEDYS